MYIGKGISPFSGIHVLLVNASALFIDFIIVEVMKTSWLLKVISVPQGITNARVYIYKFVEHYNGICFHLLYEWCMEVWCRPAQWRKGPNGYSSKNKKMETAILRSLPTWQWHSSCPGQQPVETHHRKTPFVFGTWNIRGLYQYKLCKKSVDPFN